MSILVLRTQTMLVAQVVETLKEKLSKLTPAAAEPALGCSSQTLWKMKIHDILLMLFFAQDLGQKISGGKMFCLALAYSISSGPGSCVIQGWLKFILFVIIGTALHALYGPKIFVQYIIWDNISGFCSEEQSLPYFSRDFLLPVPSHFLWYHLS